MDPIEKPAKKEGAPAKGAPPSDTNKVPLSDDIEDGQISDAISNMIEDAVHKYSDSVNKQYKDMRDDFDCLQPILSEFLDDYMIIGHTLEGQRLVLRYADSPIQLDALTELSKKVLIRMMAQEQG